MLNQYYDPQQEDLTLIKRTKHWNVTICKPQVRTFSNEYDQKERSQMNI